MTMFIVTSVVIGLFLLAAVGGGLSLISKAVGKECELREKQIKELDSIAKDLAVMSGLLVVLWNEKRKNKEKEECNAHRDYYQ